MPYKDKDRQREYQREWAAKRRSSYLAGKLCSLCEGRNDLHLHHQDPSQKVDHRIWSWAEDRRLEELAKCTVLCEECHLGLHREENLIEHGAAAYSKRGCRCEVCKRDKSEEAARYRARKLAK